MSSVQDTKATRRTTRAKTKPASKAGRGAARGTRDKDKQANNIQANVKQANVKQSNVKQSNVKQANVKQSNVKQANVKQANVKQAKTRQTNGTQTNGTQTNRKKKDDTANADSASAQPLDGGAAAEANPWLKAMMGMMPGAAQFSVTPSPEHVQMPNVQLDPAQVVALQTDYQQKLVQLWQGFIGGGEQPRPRDRRFSGAEWQGMHAYIAALYELNAEFMHGLAERVQADEKTRQKIKFAVSQWVDAMAPSNYFATNPEAQKKLIDTRGESLQAGLTNLLADLQKGRISQTDESAFEVGRNVANSVGAVVFQNDIFQLIQYKPLTPAVHERPLLMVPPSINKYYILDLQPDNSVVRNAVAHGHTVFLVSWCNPGAAQAHYTWDDYIDEGVIRAIEVVQDISRQEHINVLGFCVGGTMLTTALAVLAGQGKQPAASLTLLTTLLDFSDTGILDVFVDEAQVKKREQSIGGLAADGTQGGPVGLMPARDLATSFSFLRPNDLVWNYVVSNYLKGEAPPAFDLLYWNADSTNLPGPFFVWYLRHTYLENQLKEPGKLKVCGVPLDFSKIEAPVFIYGSREDHIVPWQSAYASTQLLPGQKRFVLGASGHIAGVINPPAKNKRSYWTYAPMRGRFPADANTWFKAAVEHPGSWWPEWTDWLAMQAGKQIKAPSSAGNARYKVIEPAPGSYVKVRA